MTYSRRAHSAEGIFRRGAEVVQDLVELIDVAESAASQSTTRGGNTKYALSALEDRLAGEQLSEDTANAPHVDGRALRISTQSTSCTQEMQRTRTGSRT